MNQQSESNYHEWSLDTERLGRRVLVFGVTDSTNNRCAEFAKDRANDGLVALARSQTAGKGQHGRHWACDAGDGVLLSVLLFPVQELCRPAVLTAWAAVSVCDLIEEFFGLEPAIKWPNDILIHNRKVCGILIEQNQGVIAGIGLNLNQGDESFSVGQLPDACSLAQFTGTHYDVEETAKQLIVQLDRRYHQLVSGGVPALESAWRKRFRLLGKDVSVEGHGESHSGELVELSFDGVLLRSDKDAPLALQPESIRHIILKSQTL